MTKSIPLIDFTDNEISIVGTLEILYEKIHSEKEVRLFGEIFSNIIKIEDKKKDLNLFNIN